MRIRKDGERYIQDRPSQSFAAQTLPPTDQARSSLRNSMVDLATASEKAPHVAGHIKWALAACQAALEAL